MTSPTGSGSAAMSRTCWAIAATRASSSSRRSSSAADRFASRPASRSRALASRISGVRAISASAIACSAASLSAVGIAASRRDAALAERQMSATDGLAMAIAKGARRDPVRLARRCPLELQDRVALGDGRRVDRRADVVLDPRRGAPGGLVGPLLRLADGHGHPAAAVADGRVADEARDASDEVLDVLLTLREEVEELGCSLARIGP